jgi:hypothetical protein
LMRDNPNVIPEREHFLASPESITAAAYGFRARRFAASGNDT